MRFGKILFAAGCFMWAFPLWSSVPLAENAGAARRPAAQDRWLAVDKARHFTASALLAGASAWQARHRFHCDSGTAARAGIGIAFSLGIAKELADARKPGSSASWKDLGADVLGIAAGILLLGGW